jgi:hypothetical protein
MSSSSEMEISSAEVLSTRRMGAPLEAAREAAVAGAPRDANPMSSSLPLMLMLMLSSYTLRRPPALAVDEATGRAERPAAACDR